MSKIWFITGSSRGLGRAIAEKALAEGDKVVATARRTDALEDLVSRYGDSVLPLALDVTNQSAVEKAVNDAQKHFSKLDVLVNNAGFANMDSIEEMSMESFKQQMDTDYYGTLYTIRAVVPFMRQQKSGHIINISSIGGRVGGTAGLGAYQSAKFAVNGLTGVLAEEVKPFNVKVTVVEPGGMTTDWGGSSMKTTTSDLYKDTVGQMVEMIHSGWNANEELAKYASDPTKVANVIYALSEMENAPVHLLMGKDAIASAKQYAAELASSDEENQKLSESTSN